MRLFAPIAFAAVLTAGPAMACSVMAPIDNTPAIHALFAARSVAAAATVDIAVAESARPLVDAALWRAWAARQPYGPGGRKDAERIVRQSRNKVVGQRITYRVVERLKGNSPATFTSAAEPSIRNPIGPRASTGAAQAATTSTRRGGRCRRPSTTRTSSGWTTSCR
jgi:hypothetical protein